MPTLGHRKSVLLVVANCILLFFLPPERAAITDPPVDAESLTDRERLVGGGSVTYICEVEGIPTPTVTWYHNGGDVPDGVSVNSNQLTIAEPQVSHSGVYQCQATNIIGDTQYEDSRMWILEVRMPGEALCSILAKYTGEDKYQILHVYLVYMAIVLAYMAIVQWNFRSPTASIRCTCTLLNLFMSLPYSQL